MSSQQTPGTVLGRAAGDAPTNGASAPIDSIVIRGAQEHNLRNVDLDLPRHSLICLTGLSGSGKSSLAFDTIFKEGQRRYLESLSAYARQFLGQMEKPRVEHIAGLSPTVAVDQKTTNRNPRSTVGTITEIYDYLRVLFARVGRPHCPKCGDVVERQTPEQIVDRILALPAGTRFSLLAPVVRGRKGEYREDLTNLRAAGYVRARIDGEMRSLDETIELSRYVRHTIEVVFDRLTVSHDESDRSRLTDSIEGALELGKGLLTVLFDEPLSASAVAAPLNGAVGQTAGVGLVPAPQGSDGSSRTGAEVADQPGGSAAGASEAPAGKRRVKRKEKNEASKDDSREWFLSRFGGCPKCGVNLPELEPRLFSFNTAYGACPKCDGLGKIAEVDPNLVVPDKTKSIRGGALACTNENGYILYSRLAPDGWEQLAAHFGFSLDTPWRELSPEHQKLVLHGSGRARFDHHWRWESADGKNVAEGVSNQRFPGIIPTMRQAYEHSPADHIERFVASQPCPECGGRRLRAEALAVTFHERKISDLAASSVGDLLAFFDGVTLGERESAIGGQLLREIRARLGFLRDVGLTYLTLERTADTLAGGEAQRLRLAAQLGAGLEGVLYVLDEPSIGLHHRDNQRLLSTLHRLRDRENTVLVVEHDEETIRSADWVVDFGPGAGRLGGVVVAAGRPEDVAAVPDSLTAQFLRRELTIEVPTERRSGNGRAIRIVGAREHNLQNVDVTIPLGALVAVTGVSGSGKSTLVDDILKKSLSRQLHGAHDAPGAHDAIEGVEHVDKVIEINQSPIGRTPRSNPATYTGLLDHIRALFANLPESKVRGYKPGRFSFNVKGGRCEACGGGGMKTVEMQFLADVEVPCEVCGSKRFNNETLRVKYRDRTISDVLDMTVAEARDFFDAIPPAARILQTLVDVGLGYISLGQSSTTLSGGEAQRIKLAEQLARPATGRTLYVLDEPTTGLHFADVKRLLEVLQRLVDLGNTVLVVEHNPDVIKVADYIVDLGPEGGSGGGRIVAFGTPEAVAEVADSYTGQMLRAILAEAASPFPDPFHAGEGASAAPLALTVESASAAPLSLPGRGDGGEGCASHPTANGVHPTPNGSAGACPPPIGRTNGDGGGQAAALPGASGGPGAVRSIRVRGARKHNLKNVDVDIPKNQITVVTGVSGSGKSSLAIDTIFAEGQRRFVECLSSYARQFLGRLDDAAVERIDGLSPAIAIDQKYGARSPRSTVATATEIFDYFRLLWARLGAAHCPGCGDRLIGLTSSEVVGRITGLGAGARGYILAPVEREYTGDVAEVLRGLKREGFRRALVDGREVDLAASDEAPKLAAKSPQDKGPRDIEVIVDRVVVDPQEAGALADSVELALSRGAGVAAFVEVAPDGALGVRHTYSSRPACDRCGVVLEQDLSPRDFSANYHVGACDECKGLGVIRALSPDLLVPNPDLSYLEGAVTLVPAKEAGHHRFTPTLRTLGASRGFTLSTPWRELSPEHQRLILFGARGETLTVHRERQGDRSQWSYTRETEWEGVIPIYTRWFKKAKDQKWAQWIESFMSEVTCEACGGEKLKPIFRAVRLGGRTIGEVGRMAIRETAAFFGSLDLSDQQAAIAAQALKEINDRLHFLADVGLDYLTLDRPTSTLSGGEAQRIRLATQVGAKLVDALYVLDEPSIGLHQRDVARLLRTLQALRDLGNTVIVVEHDEEIIRAADHVVDVGPGPGREGGRIVATGTPVEVAASEESLTGAYLRGHTAPGRVREAAAGSPFARGEGGQGVRSVSAPAYATNGNGAHPTSHHLAEAPAAYVASGDPDHALVVRGAREHNLKDIDVAFPLGKLVAVTGVSGSGKSTLVADVLERALFRQVHKAREAAGAHRELGGVERIDRVVSVDQHPIGRSPKSNPATYTGVFDQIRNLFAEMPEAKSRGYTKSRFSFNDRKGWCPRCEGEGVNRVSMHFLADVEISCDACDGKRYNAETLAVKYRGKSVADVLEMRVSDARDFFAGIGQIRRPLEVLCDVGLGYMQLGQSSNSLSGGEAQRVKLAAELCRTAVDRTVYILDEPTVGLHFADVTRLLHVLRRLVEQGQSVIVVEHNLDVIAAADHVIDLGPEGGDRGGYLVASGGPAEVSRVAESWTGQFLAEHFARLNGANR